MGVIERTSTDWTSTKGRARRSMNEIECIEKLREKFRNVKEPKQIFGPTNQDEEGIKDGSQTNKEPKKRSLLTSKQIKICQKISQAFENSQARDRNSKNSSG